jgi:signal peptidase I
MANVLSAARNFSAGFLMALPVAVAVSDNIVGISRVHGDSMLPCLQHGDVILVSKCFPPRTSIVAIFLTAFCVSDILSYLSISLRREVFMF